MPVVMVDVLPFAGEVLLTCVEFLAGLLRVPLGGEGITNFIDSGLNPRSSIGSYN